MDTILSESTSLKVAQATHMDKPTRHYSKKQENKVAKIVEGRRTANSGATAFDKGDVSAQDILIECKTLTKPQKSHTIQKAWLTKNEEEAYSRGKVLSALAFDFGDGEQFFILSARDFKNMYDCWKREQEDDE